MSLKNGGKVDKDYVPTLEEFEQSAQEHAADVGMEGVDEGPDSVLVENRKMLEDANKQMDTIARPADHPYYLRSLEHPGGPAGMRLEEGSSGPFGEQHLVDSDSL